MKLIVEESAISLQAENFYESVFLAKFDSTKKDVFTTFSPRRISTGVPDFAGDKKDDNKICTMWQEEATLTVISKAVKK